MRIFRLTGVLLMATLSLWAQLSAPRPPDLAQIPPGIAEAWPYLVQWRANLMTARASLNARIMAQRAACGKVDPGSAQDKGCLAQASALLAEVMTHNAQSEAFNRDLASRTPPAPKPQLARTYIPSGNALIGGVSWRIYAQRKPGADAEAEKRMCHVLSNAGEPYASSVDCHKYNFVLGVAESVDWFDDVLNRAMDDDLSNGGYSAVAEDLMKKMQGRQFDELGCHSNGAMLCLYMLRKGETQATNVVLYGPQVTRESLEMWDQLVRDGKVKSVKMYINENDFVPGLTMAYKDVKHRSELASYIDEARQSGDPAKYPDLARKQSELEALDESLLLTPAVHILHASSMKEVINTLSPRVAVQTFPCAFDKSDWTRCHEMSTYQAKVSCTGRSSGAPVPGTRLHGVSLPEPPLPCASIGEER